MALKQSVKRTIQDTRVREVMVSSKRLGYNAGQSSGFDSTKAFWIVDAKNI